MAPDHCDHPCLVTSQRVQLSKCCLPAAAPHIKLRPDATSAFTAIPVLPIEASVVFTTLTGNRDHVPSDPPATPLETSVEHIEALNGRNRIRRMNGSCHTPVP